MKAVNTILMILALFFTTKAVNAGIKEDMRWQTRNGPVVDKWVNGLGEESATWLWPRYPLTK